MLSQDVAQVLDVLHLHIQLQSLSLSRPSPRKSFPSTSMMLSSNPDLIRLVLFSTSHHLSHLSFILFQVELLEKAKMKNIIVYLGTGSGKTFIAVMLIKHLRDEVALKKKVVFLANNVALLEQQAEVISKMTGLKTGSYCGAHGVDDWGRKKWEQEWADNQVLVFIHQVFLNTLARGYIKMSDLALIIIDECHHAVKVCKLSYLPPSLPNIPL